MKPLSQNTKILLAVTVVGVFVLAIAALLLRSAPSSQPATQTGTFGTAGSRQFGGTGSGAGSDTGDTGTSGGTTPAVQKIFKISDGPVSGATFVQTQNPTTTLARFVMQTDGHTYDLPLDVPGAILRLVSNTTIPGIARILWSENGASYIGQYLDGDTVKTVYIGFPKGSFSAPNQAQRIQFFPDNILSAAVSPDGARIAYITPDKELGSVGYISNVDTTGVAQLFTMPIRQLLVSWPSATTLLLQTKSNTGVSGAVFAVGAKSGSVVPLVYGNGITASANSDYSRFVYQTRDASASTYEHVVTSGADYAIAGNPSPERCVWDSTTSMYCALETASVGSSFLDLWHKGVAWQPTGLAHIDLVNTILTGVATPGVNGGTTADIGGLSISPDHKYLMYINRTDGSLWGVRLTK